MTDFLLLHGPGHGGWVWDGVVGAIDDALRRRTGLYHSMYTPGTILAPDLPGHGARFGEDNPLDLTFDHCVEDLLRTVEDAGLRNPVIGVHSLSGLLALELARRLGDVKALVLVGAAVPDLFHNPVETLPLPTRAALGALRLYPNTPPESVRMVKEMALALLCNDIPFPDAARAVVGRLRPIPLRPGMRCPTRRRWSPPAPSPTWSWAATASSGRARSERWPHRYRARTSWSSTAATRPPSPTPSRSPTRCLPTRDT